MNRKSVLLATAAIAVTITAFAGTQSKDDPLDATRAAPDTHKLAFENAFVRVLDVRVPPGSIEKRQRKAGTFAWSEAIVHTVENVGKTEGHILRVELQY